MAGANPPAAEDLLGKLVVDHAMPAIRAVADRRLSGATRTALEDVCGTAVAWLITSLRRRDLSANPIQDFEAYAAGIAAKAVAQHTADRWPERARLRRRIRLLCSSDTRFFITNSSGPALCGLQRHSQLPCAAPSKVDETKAELSARRLPLDFAAFSLLFFETLAAPLDLNTATAVFADLLGIAGQPVSLDALAVEPAAALNRGPGPERAPEWAPRLWAEIRDLPINQRRALLLNLRLPDGSAIELLEELGVVDLQSLAEALDMDPLAVAGLWGRLPLDDLEIASSLGLTRQQVINLRASARDRLRRRGRHANSYPIRQDKERG